MPHKQSKANAQIQYILSLNENKHFIFKLSTGV